jgi:hypothetical protein
VHIDHINGDGLDCRKENMRYASAAQNLLNVVAPRNSSSGYKNVNRFGDKWTVRLNVDGKPRTFGYYEEVEDAAAVADAAIRRFHGEFGRPLFDRVDSKGDALLDRYLAGEGRLIGRSKNRTTRLTPEIVRQIKTDYAAGGVLQRELAERYGVKAVTISHVITGRIWKDVAA